jgi:DtxR family Mn-dependent transcriptional regulator
MNRKHLSPAVEDYLEAILALTNDGEPVRSVEIAEYLELSRAAVSKAMVNLAQEGLVEHALYGRIRLTETGQSLATEILLTHRMLKLFLVETLGVSEKAAEQDACRLEHVISAETRQKWLDHIESSRHSF